MGVISEPPLQEGAPNNPSDPLIFGHENPGWDCLEVNNFEGAAPPPHAARFLAPLRKKIGLVLTDKRGTMVVYNFFKGGLISLKKLHSERYP